MISRLAATGLLVVASGATAFARQAADSSGGKPPTGHAGAPVVFADDTILWLYGSLGPFSAAQRAAAASERLKQIAPDVASGSDSIILVHAADGFTELAAGDVLLFTVLDSDATPTGVGREQAAVRYTRTLQLAISTYARSVSLRALSLDTGYAVLATLLLAAVLFVLHWAFQRLHAAADATRRSSHLTWRIQNVDVLTGERTANALHTLVGVLRVALTILVLYFYLPLVLSFFPWTVALSRRIVGYALTPLGAGAAAFAAYLPNVFYIAVIVLVTRYLLKLVHAAFRALESGAFVVTGFHRDWAEPTYKIARVLVLAFATILVFPYLPGAQTEAFKGVSLFFGVLFSLGSSSAIGNVVAGVVLTYTRAFQIGDRVKIGETIGDVIERTLLVTRVKTIKNVVVTVPNGTVLGDQVVNYSRLASTSGLILYTTVTIGYDAPWHQVHALLLRAAAHTDHVLADPAPFVLQTSLDDFYVSYQINAYTDRPDLMAVTESQLHENIQDAFNAADVEIMSPHYTSFRDGNPTTIPVPFLSDKDRDAGAAGRTR